MSLNELYANVAKAVDTEGTEISAAETSRVIACLFDELAKLPPAEAMTLLARGMDLAGQRAAKAAGL